MPPPAEGFASRLVLGPALRAQPDRRLVALVRSGYELAFEEIVRRYGRALGRYATAIVGSRADDVTQDAFSKALLALRRDGTEIELRPWLFRIVRNTALNDLRDNPPSAEMVAESIAGGRNPAEELERREELTDLMQRLQSLPEPQRAAIVMRELEGLSHEEIATALGLSGGAARQAIYRARQALREGLGLLLPLPLLRLLVDHGGDAAALGAGAGGAAAASGAVGSAGAGMALKAGVVTAVLAGSVGTGIALQDRGHSDVNASAIATPSPTTGPSASSAAVTSDGSSSPSALGEDHGKSGSSESDRSRGKGRSGESSDESGPSRVGSQNAFTASDDGPGPIPPAHEHRGRHGPADGDDHGAPTRGPRADGRDSHHDGGDTRSGPGPSGERSSDESLGGGRGSGDGRGGPGPSGGEGGDRGSGGEGSGSGELAPSPPEEELRDGEDRSGSESSGSGSGDPGRNYELP